MKNKIGAQENNSILDTWNEVKLMRNIRESSEFQQLCQAEIVEI